jgi:hypothetical protein
MPRRPLPLQTLDGLGDEDLPLMMAKTWAAQTSELLALAKERRKTFRAIDRIYERNDGDGITEEAVGDALRSVWGTETLLVFSASQLETWTAKLYRARDRRASARHPHLTALRNALAHLDEADIDDDSWIATPRTPTAARRGIGALPNAELSIGLSGDGKLFGILTHEELERLVDNLLDELAQEIDDYASAWYADQHRD